MSDLTEWKLINTFWKRRDFNDYVSKAELNWEPKMLKTLKLIHLILRRYSRFSPKIFQFWKFRLVRQNYVIKKWSLNFFCIFWHPQIQLKIFFIIFSQNQSNKHLKSEWELLFISCLDFLLKNRNQFHHQSEFI